MILDAIIEFFVSLLGPLFRGVAVMVGAMINLVGAGLELLIALVVPGFKMKRIAPGKQGAAAREEDRLGEEGSTREFSRAGALAGLVLIVVAICAALTPSLMKRSITLVATDGHSLPHAGVILHKKGGDQHLRSDNAGNFDAPRFGLKGITVKDPRYVEQTWSGDAITRQLVVRRTVLGAGLDRLAGKLLQPAAD